MSTSRTKPIDFARHRLRSRFEAWLLDVTTDGMNKQYGDRKREAIGAMAGTVVEIGPGTGANLPFYPDDTVVIGIEPNPLMHERLRRHAAEYGVDLEIRTLRGEHLDVEDESVDGVVGTLVLCGVDDPVKVVHEVRRVLRPGGTYFFLEHVGAPEGSRMRRLQHIVNPIHRWVFNGCEIHRDTGDLLRGAGFAELDLDEIRAERGGFYTPDFVVGSAVR